MKILLITFSGSGHTLLCQDFIAKYFKENGHEVTTYEINEHNPFKENIKDYDMFGIGYPIHAFNAPGYVARFVKRLPKTEKKIPYFIYKVSGEPFAFNNASSYHIYRKLKKKGYVKYAEKHFLMPYNIMFRYNDSIAKQMYLYLDALTNLYVKEILNDKPEVIPYKIRHIILSFFLRIEWVAPKVNGIFVRMNKRCVKCNQCLNNCPTNAIYLNKKGKYIINGNRCALCMRCTMDCPKDAIIFGFMNPWKVNRPYGFNILVKNKDISPEYINHETKGYFKKFNKYFDKQKQLLKEYQIPNPIEDYLLR